MDDPILHPAGPIAKDGLEHGFVNTWPTYRKHAVTRAVRVDGPFDVETSEGTLHCEDGYLAVDARGYPYPIATDEFELIYAPEDSAAKTRPSAIVQAPDGDTKIRYATTVELLYESMARAIYMRDAPEAPGEVKRELSLAITHIEDAITRVNKAHYMIRGVFAISDAER